jgi:DNA-binding transcriptional LysR family regulator
MRRTGLIELNAVATVANRRSFRAAAAELGMSPSALSHAIAALEQRLQVRLFNRTTRSVSLSEAGELFLARIQPALREIFTAMEQVNDLRDTPAGTLRINTSEGAAEQVLRPVVLKFLKRYPDMQVEIVTDQRLVDIVAEGFDAGIRLAEAVPRDMIALPCGPDQRFAVVASPQYFKGRKKPLTPGDLAEHNCIRYRFSTGTLFRWEFEKRGEELAIDVKGSLTLTSQSLRIEAAVAGLGIIYVNDSSVAKHVASGRLIRVLDDWTPSFPGLRLYYSGHRHVPAGLRAFIAVLREANRHWPAAD